MEGTVAKLAVFCTRLTGVIAQHGAYITPVDIIEERQTYFEIDVTDGPALPADLSGLPVVRPVYSCD
jgi:hypothetical protein